MTTSLYPCPCCGYLTFDEPPGSDEFCPICKWQDDLSQLRFPGMGGGENRVSLFEAQLNYAEFGSSEPGRSPRARLPNETDARDREWRPIDEDTDNFEDHNVRSNYAMTYPSDRTSLYYWRPNYWRRPVN